MKNIYNIHHTCWFPSMQWCSRYQINSVFHFFFRNWFVHGISLQRLWLWDKVYLRKCGNSGTCNATHFLMKMMRQTKYNAHNSDVSCFLMFIVIATLLRQIKWKGKIHVKGEIFLLSYSFGSSPALFAFQLASIKETSKHNFPASQKKNHHIGMDSRILCYSTQN